MSGLAFLGIVAVVLLISLLPMLIISTPKTWCRTCKHQRSEHDGGVGRCQGDDFDECELTPTGRRCRCASYVANR
ncbi:hypothetical protein [Streptomyces sp. ICBB 8177]|uniref:hypothetical protein n=1 Tax=Streptomyces sp. ICBB 8177 TaxID=563922 RepID=UPI000D675C6F|nr:hypothetical protein [Streptomyces sp. ICBB 8177]PWI43948.1 hypothetical protein CK485_17980 [Streptomyces sp. ICBB 8177]